MLNAVLHTHLEGEQGGILKKHHGKAAHQVIMEAIVDFAALSAVIDLPKMF